MFTVFILPTGNDVTYKRVHYKNDTMTTINKIEQNLSPLLITKMLWKHIWDFKKALCVCVCTACVCSHQRLVSQNRSSACWTASPQICSSILHVAHGGDEWNGFCSHTEVCAVQGLMGNQRQGEELIFTVKKRGGGNKTASKLKKTAAWCCTWTQQKHQFSSLKVPHSGRVFSPPVVSTSNSVSVLSVNWPEMTKVRPLLLLLLHFSLSVC